MNPDDLLPPRLIQLGEALTPVLARFAVAPAHTAYAPALHDFDAVMALLDRMQAFTTCVTEEVDRLAAEIVDNAHADAQTVTRATARFEAVLDDWRRLDADAGAVWLPDDPDEVRTLLQGALRHIHGDIHRWLGDLVGVLTAPPDRAAHPPRIANGKQDHGHPATHNQRAATTCPIDGNIRRPVARPRMDDACTGTTPDPARTRRVTRPGMEGVHASATPAPTHMHGIELLEHGLRHHPRR